MRFDRIHSALLTLCLTGSALAQSTPPAPPSAPPSPSVPASGTTAGDTTGAPAPSVTGPQIQTQTTAVPSQQLPTVTPAATPPDSTPPAAIRLTIGDAIAMALRSGTQSQLAESEEARAHIAQSQALQDLLPQTDARLLRYNQSINLATFGFAPPGVPPIVGPFNVTDAQIAAAMQLFNLAALRAYQSAGAGVQASRYDREQAENDIAAAVARLYVIVQRATAQARSREADVILFTRLAEVATDEFKAGTGTRLDVSQAHVQLARSRQALLVAQNDRQNAIYALLNAIGANLDSTAILADPIPQYQAPPPAAAALATARAQRPELKAMAAHEQAAELAVRAQESRRLPSLGADFQGDLSGNYSSDLKWTRRIGAALQMPVFRADINVAIAEAKVALHDAQIQRAQRERDVEQDVRRSILSLENAEARVQVATENVKVAEEALTVAQDRRAAGYGSPVEVDRAQDTYREAHEDLIAAQADAAAAHFDVLHATGDIRSIVTGGAQ